MMLRRGGCMFVIAGLGVGVLGWGSWLSGKCLNKQNTRKSDATTHEPANWAPGRAILLGKVAESMPKHIHPREIRGHSQL